MYLIEIIQSCHCTNSQEIMIKRVIILHDWLHLAGIAQYFLSQLLICEKGKEKLLRKTFSKHVIHRINMVC